MCFQCASSGFPVVFQCVTIMQINTGSSLEHHWVLVSASVVPVASQCSSSGFPVVFQCVPIMQINTGSPLEHHWVLASASVVPVASQCTCGSTGLPEFRLEGVLSFKQPSKPHGPSFHLTMSSMDPLYWPQSDYCILLFESGNMKRSVTQQLGILHIIRTLFTVKIKPKVSVFREFFYLLSLMHNTSTLLILCCITSVLTI